MKTRSRTPSLVRLSRAVTEHPDQVFVACALVGVGALVWLLAATGVFGPSYAIGGYKAPFVRTALKDAASDARLYYSEHGDYPQTLDMPELDWDMEYHPGGQSFCVQATWGWTTLSLTDGNDIVEAPCD